VEDVKSAAGEVEFMDYVGVGQVIRLPPHDVLVLSYLRVARQYCGQLGRLNCWHRSEG
jgi:hypothetical protein